MRSGGTGRGLRLAVATGLAATALCAVGTGPAAADLSTSCNPDEADVQSAAAGAPLTSMHIADAQQWLADRGRQPAGTGVVVAVLDSGVAAIPSISQVPSGQVLVASRPGADYYHGTAVAGIIAGKPDGEGQPIGIAPAATILDVKIYDGEGTTTDPSTPLSNLTVSTGLQRVLDLKRQGMPIKVVNLSVAVPDSPDMALAIDQLWKAGVIVVASSGNRSMSEDDPLADDFSSYQPGENAAESVYPAGYPKVLAVATTADDGLPGTDPLSYILRNSAIDVAVPTSGAPSYSLAGTSCVLKAPATSWAAAEVSGVLAMLASTYPDDNPRQLRSRLLNTTIGRDDVRNPITGAGVAQPYEALTRPLRVTGDGSYDKTQPVLDQQPADLPPKATDPLRSTRRNMVWFGVVGGGVLVLALVLRPVLARRRRRG